MKRIRIIFILLVALFITYFSYSQSFNFYSIDTSNFPQMRGMFYARTQAGLDYPNVTPADFDFYEDGKLMNATLGVDCQKVSFFPQLAVVLVLDVSTSMNTQVGGGERRIDWVRYGAYAFLDSIKLDPPSVIGIVLFAGDVYKTSPLYSSKDSVRNWLDINLTIAAGSTDFYPPFVKSWPPLGAIPLLESAPKDLRKVTIFLTDGEPERPFQKWKVDTIIAQSKRAKIQHYAIFLSTSLNMDIDWICQSTGGKTFQANTKQDLINAFRKIVGDIQSRDVCFLTWIAPYGCDQASRNRNVKVVFKRIPDSVLTSYVAPSNSIAYLEFSDTLLLFGAPGIGTTQRQLTITARNADFTINSFNIAPATTKYSIDWKGKTPPFTLNKNQSHTITISYIEATPTPSTSNDLYLDASPCPPKPVSLVAPCGGEVVDEINFGNVPVLSVKPINQNCAFKNTTAVEIEGDVTLDGADKSEFRILSGGGKFSLKPGECHNVSIAFEPKSLGNKNAVLKYNIPNVCGDFQTKLVGNAIPSDFPIQPIDFDVRRILTTNDTTLTIVNRVGSNVVIERVELEDPDDKNFTFKANFSLPKSLGPSESISFDIQFNPQTEGYHSNTILLYLESSASPARAQLVGIGGLPKIDAPDVNCGKTKPATTVQGQLVITNTSQTMDLFVSEVVLQASSEFKFASGAVTQNFVVPKNNGTHTIPIDFTPNTVGLRKIIGIIKSDAAPGPLKNPTVNDTIEIFGIGEGLIVIPTPINFGTISECATKTIPVIIDNSSFSDDLIVSSVSVSGTDFASFEVVRFPAKIIAGGKDTIFVRFDPKGGKSTYNANLDIRTSLSDASIPMTGNSFTEKVKVGLPSEPIKTKPEGTLSLPFTIKVANDHGVGIQNIDLNLKYYTKVLQISKVSSKNNNWTWNFVKNDDGSKILGSGSPLLSPFEFVLDIEFEVYLADVPKPEIKVTPEFVGATECLVGEENNLIVNLQACYLPGRLVIVSPLKSQLFDVAPNPTSENFDVNFSLSFESRVSIELYNSFGQRVNTIYEGVMKEGNYSILVDTKELNSGVYFVKLSSEGFSSIVSVVLLK